MVGRVRDTFGCAGYIFHQSVNPLSFCRHKSYVLAELLIKKEANGHLLKPKLKYLL